MIYKYVLNTLKLEFVRNFLS